MEQYRHLEEIMNAIARFMDKPRNPAKAMSELCDKLGEHWREALQEYDEVTDIINGLEATETEARDVA